MDRAERRRRMIEYLWMKVAEEDWHGVQDAGSDLRDIDSEERGAEQARKEGHGQPKP